MNVSRPVRTPLTLAQQIEDAYGDLSYEPLTLYLVARGPEFMLTRRPMEGSREAGTFYKSIRLKSGAWQKLSFTDFREAIEQVRTEMRPG